MSPESKALSRPAKVLLVDDEPLVRLPIAEALRDAGFEVIEASSASEALAFLAAGEAIDFMFSDIQMPGAADGVALAERARSQFPTMPILLTSGGPEPVNLGRFSSFIAKPYLPSHAVRVILTMMTPTQADD